MSVLVLVRHGQAATFEDRSDRLTDVGERQARELASWWRRAGVTFDEAYCGTLERQRRTAEIAGECYGAGWPELQVSEEWNEYDAAGLLGPLAEKVAFSDERFRKVREEFERNRRGADRNRYFQRMLEYLVAGWLDGTALAEGVEPWVEFRARVERVVRRVTAGEGSRRVVVFTSGGVIGRVVQLALGAPDGAAIEVNWRVKNCSLTEFLFSKDRFTLDSFNALPHWSDAALVTFR